jgi:sugar phosphate isomerase/epimerase
MKIGFVGSMCPPPEGITDELVGLLWQIEKAAEYGCRVFQPSAPLPRDQRSLTELARMIRERGIELEIEAPRAVFSLAGSDCASARAEVEQCIRVAQSLGSTILRNGYGSLVTKTSRFRKDIPLAEHLEFLALNLREAAKIFEDNAVYYAMENHCDFTGRELVQVFEAVDSSHVGAALDTGNGFTVYWDPNDDIDALAPYTITTHIKDMKVSDHRSDVIPFRARGCPLGQGHVDLPRALDLLETYSPHAEGLHLVLEQDWLDYAPGADRREQDRATLEQSLDYLKNLIT